MKRLIEHIYERIEKLEALRACVGNETQRAYSQIIMELQELIIFIKSEYVPF